MADLVNENIETIIPIKKSQYFMEDIQLATANNVIRSFDTYKDKLNYVLPCYSLADINNTNPDNEPDLKTIRAVLHTNENGLVDSDYLARINTDDYNPEHKYLLTEKQIINLLDSNTTTILDKLGNYTPIVKRINLNVNTATKKMNPTIEFFGDRFNSSNTSNQFKIRYKVWDTKASQTESTVNFNNYTGSEISIKDTYIKGTSSKDYTVNYKFIVSKNGFDIPSIEENYTVPYTCINYTLSKNTRPSKIKLPGESFLPELYLHITTNTDTKNKYDFKYCLMDNKGKPIDNYTSFDNNLDSPDIKPPNVGSGENSSINVAKVGIKVFLKSTGDEVLTINEILSFTTSYTVHYFNVSSDITVGGCTYSTFYPDFYTSKPNPTQAEIDEHDKNEKLMRYKYRVYFIEGIKYLYFRFSLKNNTSNFKSFASNLPVIFSYRGGPYNNEDIYVTIED